MFSKKAYFVIITGAFGVLLGLVVLSYASHNIPAFTTTIATLQATANQDSFTGDMVNLGIFALFISLSIAAIGICIWIVNSEDPELKNDRPGY